MNLPSSWIEATPSASAFAKAATARSAKAISSSLGVKTRLDHRDQIAAAELGVRCIHSHIEKAGPRPRQRSGDGGAGRRLLGGRDGVFEVEDHRVGVERQRLLDPARMVARREQKTAKEGNQNVSCN